MSTDDDKAWAAKKAQEVTEPLPLSEAERLALMDALRASFRVGVAGIDVTDRVPPRLPPELDKPKG